MQVVLVAVECLRRDHLHCYGYERETTPFLDSVVLSRQGLMFSNFTSLAASTTPTFRVFAENTAMLSRAGVDTVCYSANPAPASRAIKGAVKRFVSCGPCFPDHRRRESVWVARDMVSRAISEYSGKDNFFLILHTVESHAPYCYNPGMDGFLSDSLYKQHSKRWGQFADHGLATIGRFGGLLEADEPIPGKVWNGPPDSLKGLRIASDVAFYMAAYDSSIRRTDQALEPLFDAFPDAEIYVTGDHGEAMGERGFMHHAYGHFPELLNVPLIVRTPFPLPEKDRSVETACHHRNMMNTIARRFKNLAPRRIKPNGASLPWPKLEPLEDVVKRRLQGLGYLSRDNDLGG